MLEIEVLSPAKVNLFLAVTGRRADGFHALSSVVSQLSFGDRLRVARMGRAGEIALSCSEPSLPVDERNLAYKAAAAFRSEYSIGEGVRIDLEKRIPSGAGLGGGSGNASVVLNALAELFGVGDAGTLERLAAEIGSDCPLFLGTGPCVMRGRGELIERLGPGAAAGLAGKRLVLFKPSVSIPTVWAYQALAAEAANYADETWAEGRMADWRAGRIGLDALLFNSFERPVFRKIPALFVLKARLRAECGATMLMSGSGSACFVICDEGVDAGEIGFLVKDCLGDDVFLRESIMAE